MIRNGAPSFASVAFPCSCNQGTFAELRRITFRTLTKRRVWEILEPAAPGDEASRRFDVAMITLIALNIVGFILQTVRALDEAFRPQFAAFEVISVVAFTVEYVLRVWSSPASSRYAGAIAGRIRFMLSPMALIDLLAVLPFWLPFTGVDLRFLRALRLFRVFRVLKLQRYSRALQMIGRVVAATRAQLAISVSVVLVLLLVSSSLMYLVENPAQPEAFSSIPASMWWAVATLTTVGYGDVYPITRIGKLLGAAVAVLGIGMFALPTSILGAAFVEELSGKEATHAHMVTCPHCGKEHGVPT